nr:hypothetical protein [uncultured Acetatifactor sp.]
MEMKEQSVWADGTGSVRQTAAQADKDAKGAGGATANADWAAGKAPDIIKGNSDTHVSLYLYHDCFRICRA